MLPHAPTSTLFPYTTLFRSTLLIVSAGVSIGSPAPTAAWRAGACPAPACSTWPMRSEEHTSELQSRFDLVCRLLLEKKKGQWQAPRAAAVDWPSELSGPSPT